jgi:hypothetical protein
MQSNQITIADFLPKYPYIDKIYGRNTEKLIAYDNNSFEQTIYKKKEFNDNKLDATEAKPKIKGQLMSHQKNIARYMSIVTPYDGLLLFHAMGTGKACVAVGVGEELRAQNQRFGKKIKGMIFLARGPNILNNIAKELVYVCTDGKYIPEDIDKIKPEMQMAKIKRSLLPFYGFYTIDKFIKIIKSLTDSQIKSRYSNYAFCIDEVHNLRTKDASNKLVGTKDYNYIHNFLHKLQYKKVILLSGTPMADQPSEIADIMNLILPLNKQMPTGIDFDSEFLIQDNTFPLIYSLNPDSENELKQYFKGRVSYLKSIQADVKVQYIGDKSGYLQYLNIFIDHMEVNSIQNKSYLEAYAKDSIRLKSPTSNPKLSIKADVSQELIPDDTSAFMDESISGTTGLFHNSQQASIAVFPNGTYGSTGFNQYIEAKTKKTILNQNPQTEYSLIKNPVDSNGNPIMTIQKFLNIRDKGSEKLSDEENKLLRLSYLSVKFAKVIKTLLKHKNSKNNSEKRTTFVYCNWVKGSGCILFAKILELFGFQKASGGEKTKRLRYALLTSSVATDNQISNLIETFNDKNNVFGEIINVVIGSKIISEGISLKNVKNVHILSPHWNYTVTEQALSRAIRAFSHNVIQEILKKPITVSVYLHASVPVNVSDSNQNNKWEISYDIEKSIDITMYEKSEHKDITMKRIEYAMKESAFDCALNYNRNYRGNQYEDGSRECDYGKCDYKCDGMDGMDDKRMEDLDLSTYRLYYQYDRISYLDRAIKTLFRVEFIISFDQLCRQYSDVFTKYEILSALNNIVNNNIPLYNKYGFLSYCTSYNNFYFLSDAPNNLTTSILSNYYTKYPSIHSIKSFDSIVKQQSVENYPRMIQKLCSLSYLNIQNTSLFGTFEPIDDSYKLDIFIKLPILIQEMFLETAYKVITYYKENISKKQFNIATWILTILKWYIHDVQLSISEKSKQTEITISLLQYSNTNDNSRFRWFDKNTLEWKDATDHIATQCNNIVNKMVEFQQNSPYGWYGIASYDKIYLKDTSKVGAQNKGENCVTIDVWKLYYILMKINKPRIVRPGDNTLPEITRNKMLEYLNPSDAKKDTQFQIMIKKEPAVNSMIKGNKYIDAIKSIYWYMINKKQKQRLCADIKELLNRENYIIGEYLTPKQIKQTKQTKRRKLPRNLKRRK